MTKTANTITIGARPEVVFAVLDDACAYPCWVVGTRRIRRVDGDWPQVGARFHHGIGLPGIELRDWSRVQYRVHARRLVLDVRFRPLGTARVEIVVRDHGGASVVQLTETPTRGLAARLPGPAVAPMLWARNWWSLQRLRHEAERRVDDASRGASADRLRPAHEVDDQHDQQDDDERSDTDVHGAVLPEER